MRYWETLRSDEARISITRSGWTRQNCRRSYRAPRRKTWSRSRVPYRIPTVPDEAKRLSKHRALKYMA